MYRDTTGVRTDVSEISEKHGTSGNMRQRGGYIPVVSAYRYQVCRRIRYGQSVRRTAGEQAGAVYCKSEKDGAGDIQMSRRRGDILSDYINISGGPQRENQRDQTKIK